MPINERDIPPRLTVRKALSLDPRYSWIAAEILQHELHRQDHYTFQEWHQILKRLDSDTRTVREYCRKEGILTED